MRNSTVLTLVCIKAVYVQELPEQGEERVFFWLLGFFCLFACLGFLGGREGCGFF